MLELLINYYFQLNELPFAFNGTGKWIEYLYPKSCIS